MTCQEASENISLALDSSLPWTCRMGLSVHLFFCGNCRQHRRQIHSLDAATRQLLAESQSTDFLDPISIGRKKLMQEEIQKRLHEESGADS